MSRLWTFGDSFTAGHGCKPFGPIKNIGTDNGNYYEKMYNGYIDLNKKIWPEIVAEHFGLSLNNLGINGLHNESIFDNALKYLTTFNRSDVVIIQTSTAGRYAFPFLKERSLFGGVNKEKSRNCKIYNLDSSPYMLKTIFSSNVQNEWKDDMADLLQYSNVQENLNDKSVLLNKHKYNTIRNFFAEFISTRKYYEIEIWRFIELSKILDMLGIKNYIINEDRWPDTLNETDNLINMSETGMTGYVFENKKTIKHETQNRIDDLHPGYTGHIDIADFIIKYIENENTNIHNI
jgi:L-rhamnose mutarotase